MADGGGPITAAAAAVRTPARSFLGFVQGAVGTATLADPAVRAQVSEGLGRLLDDPSVIPAAARRYYETHSVGEMAADLYVAGSTGLTGNAAGSMAVRSLNKLPVLGADLGDLAASAGGSASRLGRNLDSSSAFNSPIGAQVNALFSADARVTQSASDALVNAVRSRRDVLVAKPGTDDLRFLEMIGAAASAGGPGNLMILVRSNNPPRLTIIEEFLHGTQSRLWGDPSADVNNTSTAFREWHVRDFMNRHSRMFGWDAQEKIVLQSELDYWTQMNKRSAK